MNKIYWKLIHIGLSIKKQWYEYRALRVRNKLLKKNYEIVKTYEQLIDLKKNPPSFIYSLFYCMVHPVSFIKYIKEELK